MEQGVAEAPLVDGDRTQAGPLGFDGTGHSGRTGAYYQDVEVFCCCGLHASSLDDWLRLRNPRYNRMFDRSGSWLRFVRKRIR